MSVVFADTSFYIALLSPADALHASAAAVLPELSVPSARVVTSDFVLIEVGNFMSEPPNRRIFQNLVARIRGDGRTRVVPASRRLVDEGLNLFARRPDKAWSLTDCTSFAIMKRLKLKRALTADRHFAQAGFEAVLR